jgi:hypothetical protein
MNESTRFTVGGALLVAGVVALTGCAQMGPAMVDGPCQHNCELTITLPEDDPNAHPTISESRYWIKAGAELKVILAGPKDTGASVLIFPENSAFVNRNGDPIYTVVLHPGRAGKTFKIGPATSCPRGGCKYLVANQGRGERRVLDPYIIIDP